MDDRPSIAVCIASYRRPDGLRALLVSLDEQTGITRDAFRVVVVDNDPERSATETLDWARTNTELTIESAHEPRPGVSHARNRSMAMTADVDLVAVIDDDMTAAPDWLTSLVAAQQRHDADVVGGRVERSVEPANRQWVARLDLFAPLADGPDGAPAHVVELGNSIMRRQVIGDAPFDPSLGAIGGEDTALFLRLHRDGRRIVVTDQARAHEPITAERATLGWMTMRSFRLGSSWTMIERAVLGRSRIVRAARALARIGRGSARGLGGVVTVRRVPAVNGLLDTCEGVGMLAGLFGVTIAEYGRGGHRPVRVGRGPSD